MGGNVKNTILLGRTPCEFPQVLYLTLRDPIDSSLVGSSVHGILQARILE